MVYKSVFFQWSIVVLILKQGESCEDAGWIQSNGNCYKIFTEPANKSVAETTCLEQKSALASISNVEENTFLVTQLSQANTSVENFWVGLHKIDNELLWNNRVSAGNIPWVDASSVRGSSDCFIFNSAKVLPVDCSTGAGFICEQWKISESQPSNCPPGTHRDVLSEKCFWYTHLPLSKAGSEVVCSLKHGNLLVLRGVLFPINIAMIITLSPPPKPVILWTSLVVKNGSFLFEDGEEFNHEDFKLRRGEGDCVALVVETGSSYQLHQKPCLEEALGFCESNMDFLAQDFSSIFGTRNNDVESTELKPSCPVGTNWQEHEETGFCYWETAYETTRISWQDARKYCQSYGGELASFHSIKEEKIGLGFQFGSVEHSYWIGMYYDTDKNSYVWSDGTPVDYTNWDDGQPNNVDRRMRCGYMSSIKKKWSLNYCGMLSWFICKAPKQISPIAPVTPTAEPLIKCEGGSTEYFFEGYCYERFTRLYGWHRSQQYCENQGRNLVSLHGEREVDFIIRLLAAGTPVQGNRMWIGLNSLGIGGAFKWTDGSVVDFANWDTDEPNNFQNQEKCANMYTQHGMWNDENCNSVMSFVCKRKNGTTLGAITTTTPAPVVGNCPKDWYIFDGRCFLPVGARATQRKNWTEAGMHCLSLGGTLASIRDVKDQAFMYFLLQNLKMETWIGLHDSIHSGVFYWTDNSPLYYTNWAQGEPSSFGFQEDCVVINYGTTNCGRWKDTQCHRELPYVCQTYPDPTIRVPFNVRGSRCPHVPGYMKQGLACYNMFTNPSSWEDAQVACGKDGGSIVSIYDMETEAVVDYLAATSLNENDTFWIGLQSTGKYPLQWNNGWPMAFSRWGSNEPKRFHSENICFSSTLSGNWQGSSCSEKKQFICQINAEEAPKPRIPVNGECPTASKSQWTEVENTCILFGLRWAFEWHTANFRCFMEGANLVSFHSMDMLDKLQSYLEDVTKKPVFIGLIKNSEGGFEWADKSPVDFVNWDQDEPQDTHFRCVDMRVDTMKWRVADCDSQNYYICAKDQEKAVSPTSMLLESTEESTSEKGGLHPGSVAAIVISLIILIVALAVVLLRLRPWENDMNRYRVHASEQITSFENITYSEDANNIDFHDKEVLYLSK